MTMLDKTILLAVFALGGIAAWFILPITMFIVSLVMQNYNTYLQKDEHYGTD